MPPTRSRRRPAILAVLAVGFVVSCGPDPEPPPPPPASVGLDLGPDDYATARSRFRTHLTRFAPPLPDARPAPTPPGAEVVSYRSGGLTLRAYASPPSGSRRDRRAVLFPHGGFGFTPAAWEMAAPFREEGYVVLIPTVRGEDGQGGHFSLFHGEVDDVLAGADHLASRPDVDPTQIFVAGHSVGGTLALLAAMASDRFRAAASFSGSPDQVEYTRGRRELIPFEPDIREEYRIRSPVTFATSFRCPARLYFGDEEFWLQPATRRTAILARRAGLDVEAVELPGGHDSAVPEAVARCLRFFREH